MNIKNIGNFGFKENGPAGIRTQDLTVISRALYRLSHGPLQITVLINFLFLLYILFPIIFQRI